MKFSATLKRWRRDRTQAEAAKHLGVSLRTYQDWEQGRRTPRGFAFMMLLGIISEPANLQNRQNKSCNV